VEPYNNPNYKDGYNTDNPTGEGQPERPPNPYTQPGPTPSQQPNPYYGNYPSNPYQQPNPYQQAPGVPPQNPYDTGAPTSHYYQPPTPTTDDNRGVIKGTTLNSKPRWTYILLGIIGVVFLGQMVTGSGLEGQSLDKLMEAGALVKSNVQDGEWWRLITPIFLHFGIMHILFNALALFAFGTQLEQLIGSPRYLIIFFLSGIGGNILALAMQTSDTYTAGASGAIFGLLGAMIGFIYRNRARLGAGGTSILRNLLFTAALNLVFTISIPGISIGGHLGGMLVGLFLGYFLSPLHVRQTIGAAAGTLSVRTRDFALEWWPILATVAIELVVLFVALQGAHATNPLFR
jgi:rhomboid protease GluP